MQEIKRIAWAIAYWILVILAAMFIPGAGALSRWIEEKKL